LTYLAGSVYSSHGIQLGNASIDGRVICAFSQITSNNNIERHHADDAHYRLQPDADRVANRDSIAYRAPNQRGYRGRDRIASGHCLGRDDRRVRVAECRGDCRCDRDGHHNDDGNGSRGNRHYDPAGKPNAFADSLAFSLEERNGCSPLKRIPLALLSARQRAVGAVQDSPRDV